MTEKITNALINLNNRKNEFEIKGAKFISRVPSIKDNINIETRLSAVLKGADLETLPIAAYNLAYAMCYLDVLLEEKPLWFNFDEITEEDLIIEVFNNAKEFENSFRGKNEDNKPKTDSDSTESKGSVEGE